MTPQEKQMIDELVDRVRNTQVQDRDDEADAYLKQALGMVPDAIYILTQTVLVQKYGLEQAQQQIADLQDQCEQMDQQLQQQAQQPKKSFLGSLLGGNDPAPQYQPVNNYGPPPSYPPPGYAPQGYGQPAYGQPVGYGAPQGGGFLRGAMQTAAGVAAGAMVFEGMESLFHGFGHEGGGERATEVVNNNYYGDESREHHAAGGDDGGFYNPGHDASSQNDFANSTQGDSYDDNNVVDDSGNDGMDDGGSGGDDGGN